jgi:hypothetical protein
MDMQPRLCLPTLRIKQLGHTCHGYGYILSANMQEYCSVISRNVAAHRHRPRARSMVDDALEFGLPPQGYGISNSMLVIC